MSKSYTKPGCITVTFYQFPSCRGFNKLVLALLGFNAKNVSSFRRSFEHLSI